MLSHALLRSIAVAYAIFTTTHSAPTPKLETRDLSFDYVNDKIRGVNLGGWFVLEPWITPSLFEPWADSQTVKDEYTFCQTLGKDEASRQLIKHWKNWIGPDDFAAIAKAGINHVRIPIGYWAVAPLDGDPYVQGQLDILDQAITWASNNQLKVMLDLHGAPGSQNGFDNSGRYGDVDWLQGSTYKQTLNAIDALAKRYASSDAVTTIEVLNEPLGSSLDLDTVKQYYLDSWGTIRKSNLDTAVTIHDAFRDIDSFWNGFMNTGVNNVMLDTHLYQIFNQDQVSLSSADHVLAACSAASSLTGTDKWTVVGEWTGAQTDCAKWLNGLGKGARYDGSLAGSTTVGSCDGKYSGTVSALSGTDKDNIGRFIEAQMDAYEKHTGWIFWTWTTESAPEWDMKDLLAGGVFPNPVTNRNHPGQCN